MEEYSVQEGIWKVTQNPATLEMSISKYGEVVDVWQGEKNYSFSELEEILVRKSYELRGEN